MTKITPDHLARSAFVYIRQSTTDQVLNNHESRRRQYGLAERARQLGWQGSSTMAAASRGVCLSTTQSTIFCIIRSMPAPMPSAEPEVG